MKNEVWKSLLKNLSMISFVCLMCAFCAEDRLSYLHKGVTTAGYNSDLDLEKVPLRVTGDWVREQSTLQSHLL